MSDAKAQAEPSMEEILASIRKIISEDADGQRPAGSGGGAPAPAGGGMSAMGDDVLELTEKVNEDGSVVSLADARSRKSGGFDFDDEPKSRDDDDDFAAGLMSRAAASASANAFAALADMHEPEPEPEPMPAAMAAPSGAVTLEQVVLHALAPVLKTWLDENLPPIVERLVREEIERVAQTSMRRRS